MPATLVPASPGIAIPKYAVIGTYHDQPGSSFVRHVALSRAECVVSHGDETRVWEMGPPLIAGVKTLAVADPNSKVHVVGWVPLTADEREAMEDWLDEVEREERPSGFRGLIRQYTASLDANDRWHRDEQGRPLFRRFSCVSFVTQACFEGAEIQLLQTPEVHPIPNCEMALVAQVYGLELVGRELIRTQIGLPGDGPWPIELPGYVCHALNRTEEVIRTTPFATPGLPAGHFP